MPCLCALGLAACTHWLIAGYLAAFGTLDFLAWIPLNQLYTSTNLATFSRVCGAQAFWDPPHLHAYPSFDEARWAAESVEAEEDFAAISDLDEKASDAGHGQKPCNGGAAGPGAAGRRSGGGAAGGSCSGSGGGVGAHTSRVWASPLSLLGGVAAQYDNMLPLRIVEQASAAAAAATGAAAAAAGAAAAEAAAVAVPGETFPGVVETLPWLAAAARVGARVIRAAAEEWRQAGERQNWLRAGGGSTEQPAGAAAAVKAAAPAAEAPVSGQAAEEAAVCAEKASGGGWRLRITSVSVYEGLHRSCDDALVRPGEVNAASVPGGGAAGCAGGGGSGGGGARRAGQRWRRRRQAPLRGAIVYGAGSDDLDAFEDGFGDHLDEFDHELDAFDDGLDDGYGGGGGFGGGGFGGGGFGGGGGGMGLIGEAIRIERGDSDLDDLGGGDGGGGDGGGAAAIPDILGQESLYDDGWYNEFEAYGGWDGYYDIQDCYGRSRQRRRRDIYRTADGSGKPERWEYEQRAQRSADLEPLPAVQGRHGSWLAAVADVLRPYFCTERSGSAASDIDEVYRSYAGTFTPPKPAANNGGGNGGRGRRGGGGSHHGRGWGGGGGGCGVRWDLGESPLAHSLLQGVVLRAMDVAALRGVWPEADLRVRCGGWRPWAG